MGHGRFQTAARCIANVDHADRDAVDRMEVNLKRLLGEDDGDGTPEGKVLDFPDQEHWTKG